MPYFGRGGTGGPKLGPPKLLLEPRLDDLRPWRPAVKAADHECLVLCCDDCADAVGGDELGSSDLADAQCTRSRWDVGSTSRRDRWVAKGSVANAPSLSASPPASQSSERARFRNWK